jgi:SAM-dependent methyltransferase
MLPRSFGGGMRDMDVAERFAFGQNWTRFLSHLDESRIAEAEASLTRMLGDVRGKTFLDIGSGSGLFSLAAHRLGATVHSFDYDPQSVACTTELKRLHGDSRWIVERGSALDADFIARLGTFDIVYSWGVLHHTGNMHLALEHAARAVKPGGQLWIAIYNDQGRESRRWLKVKQIYNRLPAFLRAPYCAVIMGPREVAGVALAALRFRLRERLAVYFERGMSYWVGVVDWVGGLPFEVAKPEEILDFYRARGFTLERLRTQGGGYGCNEFVFRR